ncbi:hypothetical protein CPB83DRAFT_899833 [Crepidotus variabilis]|uniref:Uncharacterized protein n=1 Tax=Crepidotus variabilis TaxID=179855 RepID=A0A9P6JIQ8_9AGAR|nr:hypothetical protein CPB83DRAFT_899833 [Crepidotus variabilis]
MLAKQSIIAWSFFVLYALTFAVSAKRTIFLCSSGIQAPPADGLKTNAERLAAGLTPFPPVRRWLPTRVDSAKRGTTSSVPPSGQIQVKSSGGGDMGYLSNGLTYGFYTLTTSLINAGLFTISGNLLHRSTATTGSPYVAGLIPVSRDLLVANSVNAILSDAGATSPGAKPQPNNDPSTFNSDIESAIWSRDLASGSITAQLVKDDGTTVSVTIVTDGVFFFLTPDPNTLLNTLLNTLPAGQAQAVTFTML